jgi:glycyl-tRNA synthetase beta chain
VGCIGVGLLPTGSQDPYRLRRHAQGFLQTALKQGLRLSLSALVDHALGLLTPKLTEPVAATRAQVLEFFRVRLATLLTGEGVRPDVVEAAMATGYDDPANLRQRAHAVAAFRKRPDFESLLITFKRVANILPAGFSGTVDPARFQDSAEHALFEALAGRRGRIEAALRQEAYETALEEIAALRPWVDQFFTAVLVMVEDRALQQNRLALLAEIARLLLSVADLRRLVA